MPIDDFMFIFDSMGSYLYPSPYAAHRNIKLYLVKGKLIHWLRESHFMVVILQQSISTLVRCSFKSINYFAYHRARGLGVSIVV